MPYIKEPRYQLNFEEIQKDFKTNKEFQEFASMERNYFHAIKSGKSNIMQKNKRYQKIKKYLIEVN